MSDPMTPEHLAEIEACANAATEGPWHAWDRGIGYELHLGVAAKCEPSRCEDVNGEFRETFKQADAEFIAHARTDVDNLVAEVRRLQDAIERVRAVHYETTWCDTDKVHGCKTCADVESVCDADSEYWPCPTIAALVFDTGSNHE